MPLGWFALLLLVSFPVLEAIGIFYMADRIGGGLTFLWLLADLVIGLWLVRFERVAWGVRVMQAMQAGGNPMQGLLASGRMLLAGGLLMFPGFLSDALAVILLLIPGGRAPRAARGPFEQGPEAGRGDPFGRDTPPAGPATLDGEFRRETDETRR